MDANTGRIYADVTEEQAKKRGLIPIPKAKLAEVTEMNTQERRTWAAREKVKARKDGARAKKRQRNERRKAR